MKTLKTYKQLFEQTVDIPYIFKTFFIKDDWGDYKYAYAYFEKYDDIENMVYDNKTLLSIALSDDHTVLAEMLINKGADVNFGDDFIYSAVDYMHYDLIKLLLDKGAKITNEVFCYDNCVNILENAICRTYDDWRIVDLLIKNGATLIGDDLETIYDITKDDSWENMIPELRKRFGDDVMDKFIRNNKAKNFNL